MNVLIVAAHPDDELLGVGATVARLTREGHTVFTAILGEGHTSRVGDRAQADQRQLDELETAGRKAAALLGVKDISFHGLPDNRFDTVSLLDIVKEVEKAVDRWRPQAVYTHHLGDLNIDHELTHRAVVTATRPLPGQAVRDVYAFETASATEWSFRHDVRGFRPTVFVDITQTLDQKLEALAFYRGEMRPFPHPRSNEALRARAQYWGSVAGCPAAEAFELIRSLR